MLIEDFTKVRLKTGEIATILEYLRDNWYMAEVFLKSGGLDTTEIYHNDIASVFVETEHMLEPV
ncbi:MAG: hypothetical protein FWB74_00075 [Defluviitaleaceae bacterium]|nr:hypothetical protein [Defluviitaleaceae bacterium]